MCRIEAPRAAAAAATAAPHNLARDHRRHRGGGGDDRRRPATQVKIGIGVGNVTILHLGGVNGHVEYVAVGDPLVQARAMGG